MSQRKYNLPTLLGLAFLFAFTFPIALSSVFFWRHMVQLGDGQERYLANTYSVTLSEILRVKLEEYIDMVEACAQGNINEHRFTRSALIYCGEKPLQGLPKPLFRKIMNSDALSADSLMKSSWWDELASNKDLRILFEANTGIDAAYYKKYILVSRRVKNRTIFALFDPLPLVSELQNSIEAIGRVSLLLPVLTTARGKILFAPQSIFYRAFFSGKLYSKMLKENKSFRHLDYSSSFEISGVPFQLHFVHLTSNTDPNLTKFYTLLVFVFGLSVLLGMVGVFIVLRLISDPIVDFSKGLRAFGVKIGAGGLNAMDRFEPKHSHIEEVAKLEEGIGFLVDSIKDRDKNLCQLNEELRKNELLVHIGKVTSQIAHDIRSPLTALKIALGFVSKLNEQERFIIRSAVHRIEDIANTLGKAREDSCVQDTSWVCLLSSLIEPVVTEKRVQYRTRFHLNIQIRLGDSAYGLFARINPGEFKRVISNMISNAVEAFDDRQNAQVELLVERKGSFCEIAICDNGRGIPPDVLKHVGARGFSHGKIAGSGLGVHHAKETLAQWGGCLSIRSEVGQGTRVTLQIPLSDAPAWFVPALEIESGMRVGVLDDDISIHQVWESRFREYGDSVKLVAFSEGTHLERYLESCDTRKMLFLCDYELLGQSINGLQLIRKWFLERRSVLVTSHFEDANLREECERIGLKILPKSLASNVPIHFREQRRNEVALNASRSVQL